MPFIDLTGNHVIAVGGGVRVASDWAMYGRRSIYFDGAGSYLSIAPSSLLSFGTDVDFTIEGVCKPTGFPHEYHTLIANRSAVPYNAGDRFVMIYGPTAPAVLEQNRLGAGGFGIGDQGPINLVQTYVRSSDLIQPGSACQWALTRSTVDGISTYRLFLGGFLVGSYVMAGVAMDFGAGGTYIGWTPWDDGTAGGGWLGFFKGYQEYIRVTRACRYTASYTPAEPKTGAADPFWIYYLRFTIGTNDH